MYLAKEMQEQEDIYLLNSINNNLRLLKEKSKRLALYIYKYFPVEENKQTETNETKVRRIV